MRCSSLDCLPLFLFERSKTRQDEESTVLIHSIRMHYLGFFPPPSLSFSHLNISLQLYQSLHTMNLQAFAAPSSNLTKLSVPSDSFAVHDVVPPPTRNSFTKNPCLFIPKRDNDSRRRWSAVAKATSLEIGPSFMLRPLAEILRDLNKRVPDQVLNDREENHKYIPWYHANRMLSFYAPGWCGEVRGISFSADGRFVTVIYRVTIKGSDGEAFREAASTFSTQDIKNGDPSQKAEAMAFVRACARFGLGLYLHDES